MGFNVSENIFTDHPIQSSKDDLFGRRNFAHSVAKSIIHYDNKQSLVISLYGTWGSGKTSLKNMIVEELRDFNQSQIKIIEFNPWEWSTKHKVFEAFFSEITTNLSKGKRLRKIFQYKKLAHYFKRYGNTLSITKEILSDVKREFSPFLATSGLVAINSYVSVLKTEYIVYIMMIITLISRCIPKIGQLLELFIAPKTLDEQKSYLRNELKKLPEPILIIIDDLDRLDKEEIEIVFKLVKANLDFPNINYMLLCNKEFVEQSFDKSSFNGREFIEKIVQLPLIIPSIPENALNNALDVGLKKILTIEQYNDLVNNERWNITHLFAHKGYFSTIRSVNRFLSSFSVKFASFRDAKVLEINLIDFISIEILSTFEYEIYKNLPKFKNLLTYSKYTGDTGDITNKEKVVSLLKCANLPDNARELLLRTFPLFASFINHPILGNSSYIDCQNELRICCDEFFDRYFGLQLYEDTLSASELDELINKIKDPNNFLSKFEELEDRKLHLSALEKLFNNIQKISIRHAHQLLLIFFQIGETITDIQPALTIPPFVEKYLQQESKISIRGELFCSVIRKSSYLYVSGHIIYRDLKNRDQNTGDSPLFLFNVNSILQAKRLWLTNIETMAKEDPERLLYNKRMRFLLMYWKYFASGDTNILNGFIQWIFKENSNLIIFLERMSGVIQKYYSHTTNIEYKRILLFDEINEYIPLKDLDKRIINLEHLSITEIQAQLILIYNEQRNL